jgi:hypothetical protein
MMNKDFLKEVLAEDKELLELKDVKWINAPLFDELSVINIWPMTKEDKQFMKYFPQKLPKGRVPDREYFFNILNTLYPGYVQEIIRHANAQRNSVSNDAQARESIEVSDKWWDALNAVPFISCKCYCFFMIISLFIQYFIYIFTCS